jgi:aspartyl protease family protein
MTPWPRERKWDDPWQRPPPPAGRGRRLLRLALGVALALLALSFIVPPSLRPHGQHGVLLVARIAVFAIIVVLVLAQSGKNAARIAGELAPWLVAIALLTALFAWREDVRALVERTAEEMSPGHGQVINPTTVSFRRGFDRQFWIDAGVGGRSIRFLFDTGASTVVLSRADAAKLGIRPETLRYTQRFETANGTVRAAPVTLPELRIGPLRFSNVPASVTEGALRHSLLGMRLLERLGSLEIKNDTLTIRR